MTVRRILIYSLTARTAGEAGYITGPSDCDMENADVFYEVQMTPFFSGPHVSLLFSMKSGILMRIMGMLGVEFIPTVCTCARVLHAQYVHGAIALFTRHAVRLSQAVSSGCF
jgi:hypothetical protein